MKKLLLLFILCSPAWASITLVQSNSSTTAAVSTATCALSSAVGAGDLIIGGVMWGAQVGSFAMTDDHSNSYTAVPSNPVNDGGASNQIYVAYAKNTSAQTSLTLTITITGGSTHTIRMGCFEYSATNGWQGTPLDTSNVATSGGPAQTGNAGNVTPAATGELLFSAMETSGVITANSFAVSAGCTRQDTAGQTAGSGWASQSRAESADNQNSGSSATTCTFTWTTNSHWAATIAAFKPAAAGTTVPNQFPRNQ